MVTGTHMKIVKHFTVQGEVDTEKVSSFSIYSISFTSMVHVNIFYELFEIAVCTRFSKIQFD